MLRVYMPKTNLFCTIGGTLVYGVYRVLFFNQKYLLNLKQPDLLQVGLNVGVKTSNIAFKSPLICRSVAKLVVRILLPFIPYNFKKGKNFINGLKN